MIKEFKGLEIDIDNIKHGKKCNILTFNESMFNENQCNAVSKQHDKIGFLNCSFKFKNNNVDIYYNTTGLISINEYLYQNNMITETEFIGILKTICQSIKSCSNFIYFSETNFALDGDLIYIDTKDKSIYMTYVPTNKPITDNVINDFKWIIVDWITNRLKIKIGEKNFTQGILEELRDSYLDVDKFLKFLSYSIEDKVVKGCNENNKYNQKYINESINIESANQRSHSQPVNSQPVKHIPRANIENHKEKKGFKKIFSNLLFSKNDDKKLDKRKANFNKKNIVSENAYDDNYDTVMLEEEQDTRIGYLVGKSHENAEKIQINKSEFIIGRLKESVDYDIANRAIGKVHAKFIIKDDKFYLVDLESKNGTYLNNIRLKPMTMYEIKDNSTITFANSQYIFKIVASGVYYE